MIKCERADGRWYYIVIAKDMLDDYVVNVWRGGSGRTVLRRYGYECATAARAAVARLVRVRERHGYLILGNIYA